MKNYYSILGIRSTANVAEIKAAYKKLAKAYHPDKNPDHADAEEKFKLINEAYHTLTDYSKRSRFDTLFQTPSPQYRKNYPRERQSNSSSYNQPRQQEKYYKIDKTYFRNQGLTLLIIVAIAGLCFTVVQSFQYYSDLKETRQHDSVTGNLYSVDSLFSVGKVNEAFSILHSLKEKGWIDFRIQNTHDSLVSELRRRAAMKYESQQFSSAITDYFLLHQYQEPKQLETTLKIAQCQYALENYYEAILVLKEIGKERPNDLELLYEISLIYLNNIHDANEALHYLSKGKGLIQQSSMQKIGDSFQLSINPEDAPEIYYEIFEASAEANVVVGNFNEVIKDCNFAINLRPLKRRCYTLRAIANIGNQTLDSVCVDLQKGRERGGETSELEKKYCQ